MRRTLIMASRPNKIRLGPPQRNCPQPEEAIVTADTLPGTIVQKDATTGQFVSFATNGGGDGVKLYVLNHNFIGGGQIDDPVPAGDTGIGEQMFRENLLAALLSDAQDLDVLDKPLTPGVNPGELRVGIPGTDYIVAYGQEIYNNTTGSAQLVIIRPA